MNKIRVMLADDHAIVRRGLRGLLESEPDIVVIGEAEDGLSIAEQAAQLEPDVLLLDLMMPSLNGLDVARQVKQRTPNVRIVVLSMHSDESYVLQAMRNGAVGYVLKSASTDTLVEAIRIVKSGRRYLCPPLSELAIEAYIQKAQNAAGGLYDLLTGREREVLHLAAEGMSNAEIAGRLSISPRTVEVHRAKLMEKLNLRNQTDLVKYALRHGIVSMER